MLSGSVKFQELRRSSSPERIATILMHGPRSELITPTADPTKFPHALTLRGMTLMLEFHERNVMPLTRKYIRWALSHLERKPEVRVGEFPQSLTSTEEARVTRTLYRYHLCANLLGIGCQPFTDHNAADIHRSIFGTDILRCLDVLYRSWKIEEICSVVTFAECQYKGIMNRDIFRFEDSDPETSDLIPEFIFSHIGWANSQLVEIPLGSQIANGYVSQGLGLL
ncbi:hypothetical protein N7532_001925 [Penicillium argentinense]|uniref:Uncharacterized protein n=1 Tax=Penicillium argentinense TaxID=1131581 RepID=A0A9W9KM90_9EURO|nr:uncharacterized protein N7532_001925 [Penicillium argentinense]KAJ5111390.1 hypothetical protein N7532_001925 [Penicillium argentinense]